MSPANSLLVAQALATSNSTFSPSMAKSLGQNIPAGTPLTNIASIASAVPLSCFNSTPPGTLVNLVSSMDLGNMDSFKKGFIASKVIYYLEKLIFYLIYYIFNFLIDCCLK